jgi:hypothetical protein
LLKSEKFGFPFERVLLFFAFIGFTLTLAQGLLVRRMAGKVSEVVMATAGAGVTMLGFVLLSLASQSGSVWFLVAASAVEVTGFSLMTPSLQSLISRRSDPAKQGGILGVGQSVSALARVAGPLIAVPLFFRHATLPYWTALAMMCGALAIFLMLARRGQDYGTPEAVVVGE